MSLRNYGADLSLLRGQKVNDIFMQYAKIRTKIQTFKALQFDCDSPTRIIA